MNATRCYKCGGSMRQVQEPATFNVGQRTAEVVVDRFHCEQCDEILYSPEQMDSAQIAVAAALRKQDGLLTPIEIKTIREKYRLSQAQLEQLLGVGPKTVVRWERGTVFQNRTTDELLRIITQFPEVCAYLARKNGVAVQIPHAKGTDKGVKLIAAVRIVKAEAEWHRNFNRYSLPRRQTQLIGVGETFPVRRTQQRRVPLEREVALPTIPAEELK
jgi:HTH-type transcriptional regulator / antitoxin MqsA